VSATGTVLGRLVPQGLTLPGAAYPVSDSLPAVFADRQSNRGFESLALGPDGTTLYTAVQSPLANPDAKTGKTSRAVRVLAVTTATGRPTAEYVYPLEDVAGFDPGAQGDQSQMKVSAMAWSGDQLVVDERTDAITKLYLVRLSGATNILGGELDDPAHTPSLEQATPAGVIPLTKSPLLDVTAAVPNAPTKIEGIAVQDRPPWRWPTTTTSACAMAPTPSTRADTRTTPASRHDCWFCACPRADLAARTNPTVITRSRR
jgi:hypothetical protein